METTRRKFIQYSGLGVASLLFAPKAFASSFSTGEFKLLRNNVGYFTGSGGTIGWLVNKEGIVVVDSQFPDTANELIKEVRKQTDRKVNYLINTHHHGDHTAGNIAFKDIVEHVFAHENSKKNQERVAKERDIQDKQLYPDMTFKKEWSTKVGDETISCSYHGRGHTDGDIITHFENANVVHMGDLVFNRKFPYIDKSAGAHIGNWISILDNAVKKFDDDAKIICGHAGDGYDIVVNKEDIKAFTNYLEQLMLQVEKGITAGKSLDDMKSEMSIVAGAPDWKGKGIGRSLDAAYIELTEEK
ncbi:MBL fold metallo-hydrolase [Portibacter lacus]|uniref:Cyclase n=1 Tax=Portibacter lacus TaxID=1099794 RepID=A0AA37SP32_9BACT|nr:MBL fold metallo-hydrolase [Portibacter lacus]GLR18211.1 cyclase [Portibacter lacus]